MTEPLVSVHMITYNHAPYIAQAIEGVLQQKADFPIELVIGEDCSTDNTRQIVLEYQKKHSDMIRVIISDSNVGAKKNGYRTFKACRGKYVAFCEGDDYWHHPQKLQRQVAYLESHPDCGLVYSSYDMYYVESDKRIKDYIGLQRWEMSKEPDMLTIIQAEGPMKLGILTCTAMVQRTLCERIIDSDPCLHQGNRFMRGDTQLWAEIANVSRVGYIPEALATYRQTVESATRSKDITRLVRLQISDAELALYLCNKYNLPSSLRNKKEAIWLNGLLRLAFHTRDTELANEARSMKKRLSFKELCLYYGAKIDALNYPFRLGVAVRDFFRRA